MITYLKLFALFYIIGIGAMYYFSANKTMPPVLPGDIFIRKSAQHFYVPTGTALYIAIVLLIIFRILENNFAK